MNCGERHKAFRRSEQVCFCKVKTNHKEAAFSEVIRDILFISFDTLYFFLSCLTCLSVYNLLKKLRKIGREQLLSLTAFFSCLFTQHKRNYNSGKAAICCHGDQTTLNNSSLGWCASYHRYGTWAMNRCLTRPLGILFPQNILQTIYVKERIHPFSNPVSFKILTGHSCVF